jgi:glycosyltransferase involved in cell wall biosynthesis
LASDGPPDPPPLPGPGLRLLWSGGYNTWMDAATLFAGLEEAMARREDILFHSTGGAIPGHDETSHGAFWRRARASRYAARFVDLGRVSRRDWLEVVARSHVLLAVSRACLESELGSRQRLVEGMAHGRAVVSTDLGDLAAAVREAGAGLVVPPGDAHGLAAALVRLAERREDLVACARNARALWERQGTYESTTQPLRAWVAQPARWPPSFLAASESAALQRELLRLQGDLAQIRSSRTFRTLRLIDRLLGRR